MNHIADILGELELFYAKLASKRMVYEVGQSFAMGVECLLKFLFSSALVGVYGNGAVLLHASKILRLSTFLIEF